MPYAFELLQVLNYSAIREFSIFAIMEDCVVLDLRFENHLNEARILYRDKEDDTLIEVTEYNKRLVKDKNYIDMACEDLFNILSEARLGEDMEIFIRYEHDNEKTVGVANRVYEQFKIHSQTTKNPIYAWSLNLQIENVSQLCSVLTYVNPTKLRELIISNFETEKKILDFGRYVEMDHWKNAKKIVLKGFYVNIPFENFSHCEYVKIEVSSISADDIQTLVNIASNSQCLNLFRVMYDLNENVTEQFLSSLIGEKQTNQSGDLVRLIENEIQFDHNSDRKIIYMNKFSDKKEEESIESPKPLTIQPSKSATLCLANQLIMEKIVQHFDFAELVVLRRVSRGSRYCVDLLKPDLKLVAMKISVKPGSIFFEVFSRNNDKKILYEDPGTDISSTSSNMITNYDHKADINNLSDDLFQLIKDQKTALKELRVILEPPRKSNCNYTKIENWNLNEEKFVEMFSKSIFLRGALISVEKLSITTLSLKVAEQILQNLDPVAIETIEIRQNPWVISWTIDQWFLETDIKELICLEQWTSASELKIEDFFVKCDIEKLVHISKVDIRLYSISLKDVLYLKEKFLLSPDFRQFKTKFYETNAYDSIFKDNFLGAPFRRVEDISSDLPSVWFFQYADVLEDLQIRYYQKANEFMFKRVSRR